MSRKCDQCLLSSARIVSSSRAAQILKDCARDDTHFLCHKGTMCGREIACRGHYDSSPGKVARFAAWLGVVIEIDPDTMQPTTTPATDASPSASLAAAATASSPPALVADGADLGEGE
jgi:hypothetical protein